MSTGTCGNCGADLDDSDLDDDVEEAQCPECGEMDVGD